MLHNGGNCVCSVCLEGILGRRRPLPEMGDLLRFSAAVQMGSFAGAARELGLTRATMGQSIARLERTIGAPLFRRARHGREVSRPTATGSRIYPAATSIVSTACMIVPDD